MSENASSRKFFRLFAATGPGWNNWEPMFPSFAYAYMKAKKNDPTCRNPKIVVEVDSVAEIMDKIVPYGGRTLREAYVNEEGMSEDHIDRLSLFWPKKDF